MGLLQEPLEAMFALINEMEMAIKINTSIRFGTRDRLRWVKLNRLTKELCPYLKVARPGEEKLHQCERVLKALPFIAGCAQRRFLIYF